MLSLVPSARARAISLESCRRACGSRALQRRTPTSYQCSTLLTRERFSGLRFSRIRGVLEKVGGPNFGKLHMSVLAGNSALSGGPYTVADRDLDCRKLGAPF